MEVSGRRSKNLELRDQAGGRVSSGPRQRWAEVRPPSGVTGEMIASPAASLHQTLRCSWKPTFFFIFSSVFRDQGAKICCINGFYMLDKHTMHDCKVEGK
ncbi:hypothetical protein GOODEAATRI_030407 [Goodea atripinnis]|uniref:Uncharacterized protein n=2 Tax=Goodeidae TaxID=28758 RepID=A0ABU7B1C3_9TELE|nr:hypothetical protein [Ataeniobius toweri]